MYTNKINESPYCITTECHLDKETGNCRGLFYKWHYNKATESCQEFVYGGCGGNMNRFESEQLCMSNCSGTNIV